MPNETWPRVAVVGAGAVGCYFGGLLARAGAPVTFIGRPHHVEAMAKEGLWLETLHFQERIPVTASVSIDTVRDATIVLLCVKTLDTEEVARSLAPHLTSEAIVVSLQNGVDNADRIQAAGGFKAIPAVVYVAAAMAGPGHVRHSGRGDLVIGVPHGDRQRELDYLASLFKRAGIQCVISNNIEGELWTKFIVNCAANAVSALGQATYGRIMRTPQARELWRAIVEESAAVARADGIRFPPPEDLVQLVFRLAEAMSEATSSMAQDLTRGKRTEIDSLNGYIVRRGAELGVATPINQTLYVLVKLLEEIGN